MKKKKIALLLVLTLLLSCLSGCGLGKAALAAALTRSAKEYAESLNALKNENAPDFSNGYSLEFSGNFTDLPAALSLLPGAPGIRAAAAKNGEGAPTETSLELNWGSLSLLSLFLRQDGKLLTLSCPRLLGDTALAIDTETFAEDLKRLGLIDEETLAGLTPSASAAAVPAVGLALSAADRDALLNALKTAVKEVEISAGGKSNRDINGRDLSVKDYIVTVPNSVLLSVYDALEDSVARLLESANVEDEALPADLRAAVRSLGDTEWTLGVANKLLVSAATELKGSFRGNAFDLRPALTLGGGEHYPDDLTLTLTDAGEEGGTLTLCSHGDHGSRNGVFTDRSTLSADGEELLTVKTEWDRNSQKNNLIFSVDAGDTALSFRGSVAAASDSVAVKDGSLRVETGDTTISLSLEGSVKGYQELVPAAAAPLYLSEMAEEDLYDVLEGILAPLLQISSLFSEI